MTVILIVPICCRYINHSMLEPSDSSYYQYYSAGYRPIPSLKVILIEELNLLIHSICIFVSHLSNDKYYIY